MNHRSKRHHIVPKALQKHFLNHEGKIWFSERDDAGRFRDPRKPKSIKSTFWIPEYYTVLDKDEPSDLIEREFYGRIDDYLGKVIPQMKTALDKMRFPSFDDEQLGTLRNTVFELAKRTPDFMRHQQDVEIGREIVETTVAKLRRLSHPEEDRYRAMFSDEQRLERLGSDVRVRATISRSPKITEMLQEFCARWVVIRTHHSFILTSRMTYMIGNGGPNGISNPDTEIWFPFTPKYALVLLRDPQNRIPNVVPVERNLVRHINEYAADNSQQIGSHSQRLLNSIIKVSARVDRL